MKVQHAGMERSGGGRAPRSRGRGTMALSPLWLAAVLAAAAARCPGGWAAEPQAVVTGLTRLSRIAVDGTHVFWTETSPAEGPQSGVLRRASKAGEVLPPLVSGLGWIYGGLALDDDSVYFTDDWDGTVQRVSKAGGDPVFLQPGPGICCPSSPSVDGDFVYFLQYRGDMGEGKLDRIPKAGGPMETLASGLTYPHSFLLESSKFYIQDSEVAPQAPNLVKTVLQGGGVPATLYKETGGRLMGTVMATDGSFVYWTVLGPNGLIRKIRKSGGPVATVVGDLNEPLSIAADGRFLYWAEKGDGPGQGSIRALSLQGGPVLTLAEGRSPGAPDLLVDSTHIWWTEPGEDPSAGTGSILKLEKPRDCNGNGVPDLEDVLPSFDLGAPVEYPVADDIADFPVAADIDGDGLLDLVVTTECAVCAIEEEITVSFLRGNGAGAFAAAVAFPVGSTNDIVGELAVADLDRDGDLDLAQTSSCSNPGPFGCFGPNMVSVLKNDGKGVFTAAGNYETGGDQSYSIAAGDLDGDGSLDLAVGNLTTNDLSVLNNAGDGSFATPRKFATGQTPNGVVAIDLENDGDLDLVTANGTDGTASVLRNQGGGTFLLSLSLRAGSAPWGLAAPDIEGDGFPDLAVVNYLSSDVTFLRNKGNFSTGSWLGFAPPVSLSTRGYPVFVTAADLDGDGGQDLAAASAEHGLTEVFPNLGNGTYGSAVRFFIGRSPFYLTAADLNGDGRPDIAVTATSPAADPFGIFTRGVEVLLNERRPRSADIDQDRVPDECQLDRDLNGLPDGYEAANLTLRDCDRDGMPDRAEVLGGLAFERAGDLGAGLGPAALAAVDLTEDSILDLAVADRLSRSVSFIRGRGQGSFEAAQAIALGAVSPSTMAAADLDGDGHLDLAVSNFDDLNIAVLKGRGDGIFQPPAVVSIDYNCTDFFCFDAIRSSQVVAGDLDGDGDVDLVVLMNGFYSFTGDGGGNPILLMNGGNGIGYIQYDLPVAYGPTSLAVADLDGDGDLDLAVSDVGNNLTVLRNNSDGSFDVPTVYPVGPGPVSLAAADLDGDGDPDLVTADSLGDGLSVLFNRGDGSFRSAARVPAGNAPAGVAAADLDGDGDADLAVTATPAARSSELRVLQNHGDGSFAAPAALRAGSGAGGPVIAELDGADRPDLVFVNSFDDSVTVLLNRSSPAVAEDCNRNSVPDSCDIAGGTSPDGDHDGIPDECRLDCDGDAVPDFIEIAEGTEEDCNRNLIPDSCDLSSGSSQDRNRNGVPDECDPVRLPFHRGDPNGDGRIDISDPVFSLAYLFLGGATPGCLEAGDGNDDGAIDISDPIMVLTYLFLGGSPPAPPGPFPCGQDPEPGNFIGCEFYGGC